MNNVLDRVVDIEKIIYGYLPKAEGYSKLVNEAMNYSVMGSGKRLRPLLMLLSFKMCEGNGEVVEPFMAAIEMIHSYSLVHDDLPAMDNDLLRRGKPTTWSKYGENIGILAGDGLLNFAFETALKAFEYTDKDNYNRVANAMSCLGNKSGIYGMIGGQGLDVISNGENLNAEQMEYIHRLKTCALIEASLMIGAILAGKEASYVTIMEKIGYNLGMAFQIQDDILDVIGDEETIGKPVHSDEKNEKTTYVTLYGIEKAKSYVEDFSNRAIELLENFSDNEYKNELKDLFLILINRAK